MAIVPRAPGCAIERVPSSPYVICLGDAERAELESLSRRATAPFRLVLRARIVLLAAAGTAIRVNRGAGAHLRGHVASFVSPGISDPLTAVERCPPLGIFWLGGEPGREREC
jgi:hypothetical protein